MSFLKGRASAEAPPVAESIPHPPAAPKRIRRGTDQQEALWAELADGSTNLMAEARAGCGKSSSCREGQWRMLEKCSTQRIRYAVFNKANAQEFQKDCPSTVEVATSHSFGYEALRRAFRSTVEKNKTYLILDESAAGRALPRYLRKSIAMLAAQAKNAGLDPRGDEAAVRDRLRQLALHYDINAYGRPHVLVEWAHGVLDRSLEWVELVDFDDMLWLAALHQTPFPECDAIFLDEVQDFNGPQQALVPLMCASGRVVAVGDRHQAINMFRGADADSMNRLQAMLSSHAGRDVKGLPLTVTFRCPKSHVALANELVPDLVAHESAPEGELEYGVALEDMLSRVEPGHLVICPTNAPVVSACLKLVARRVPAYVRGRAVGDQLVSILRGLGASARTVADAARGVDVWRARELTRLSQMDGVEDVVESVNDRADGLQAVLAACHSPEEAEPLIGRIFGDDRRGGVVTFSTVHRAKGDEAGDVWLIDAPTRTPKREWEAQQSRNLRYVALTRSKRRLAFVAPPEKPHSDEDE